MSDTQNETSLVDDIGDHSIGPLRSLTVGNVQVVPKATHQVLHGADGSELLRVPITFCGTNREACEEDDAITRKLKSDFYLASRVQGEVYDLGPAAYFEVGMSVGVLIRELHENTLQYLSVSDPDNLGLFTDNDVILLSGALKTNSSVRSVQLRQLPVGDASLPHLCYVLQSHPSLRALDFSQTRAADGTGRALRQLLATNSNVVHVMLEGCPVHCADLDNIEMACQYNTLLCADPRFNPFESAVIKEASALKDEKEKLEKQLAYNPFVEPLPASALLWTKTSRKKKHQQQGSGDALVPKALGREVCGQYMLYGSCRFGSRCKHFHPQRTASRVLIAQQQREELQRQLTSSQHGPSSAALDIVPEVAGVATFRRERRQKLPVEVLLPEPVPVSSSPLDTKQLPPSRKWTWLLLGGGFFFWISCVGTALLVRQSKKM